MSEKETVLENEINKAVNVEKTRRSRSPARNCLPYSFPILVAIFLWYVLNRQIFSYLRPWEKLNEKKSSLDLTSDEMKKVQFFNESTMNGMEFTDEENNFKAEILEVEKLVESNELKLATSKLKSLAQSLRNSPRCLYASARILDRISESEQNVQKIRKSVEIYKKLLSLPDVNDRLVYVGARRLVNRLHFLGKLNEANKYSEFLAKKFPADSRLKNELGISYLISNKLKLAKDQFLNVLKMDKENSVAKCHLAFVLKTNEKKLNESIELFKECLNSQEECLKDGKFYYHFGDALHKLNRTQEAYKIYQVGVEMGVFLSVYQRSLYNIPGLSTKPWWTLEETGYENYLKILEEHWESIRDEILSELNLHEKLFLSEEETQRDKGNWRKLSLFTSGNKIEENCRRVPLTCSLIEKMQPARECFNGEVKFSLMSPGTHIWPHCAPTNSRIRAHLGLVVPEGGRIRVANETRTWSLGKFLIFDDSFEHEVWYDGKETRIMLIVDFWHPNLSQEQRNKILSKRQN